MLKMLVQFVGILLGGVYEWTWMHSGALKPGLHWMLTMYGSLFVVASLSVLLLSHHDKDTLLDSLLASISGILCSHVLVAFMLCPMWSENTVLQCLHWLLSNVLSVMVSAVIVLIRVQQAYLQGLRLPQGCFFTGMMTGFFFLLWCGAFAFLLMSGDKPLLTVFVLHLLMLTISLAMTSMLRPRVQRLLAILLDKIDLSQTRAVAHADIRERLDAMLLTTKWDKPKHGFEQEKH